MDRTRQIVVSMILLFVPSLVVLAADLPQWNDDSGMSVTPYPARFAPAVESTNLVTRVFHDVDSAVDLTCAIVITDASGTEVRHFSERQLFAPGEAMQFAPTWNGRDDAGRFLPNGSYTITATIEMRAAGPRVRRQLSDEVSEDARVRSIRQRFAGTVIIDSVDRGRPIETHSQTPHEPGFPFNYYYG